MPSVTQHLVHAAGTQATHATAHHASVRPEQDARRTAHAVRTTRQLPCAAHASLLTLKHAVHIFRTPVETLSMETHRHLSRLHKHNVRNTQRTSNLRRPWPQPRSSIPRRHSGCAGHGSNEPLRLGRPAPPVAALKRHPAASRYYCPKLKASISTWLTA